MVWSNGTRAVAMHVRTYKIGNVSRNARGVEDVCGAVQMGERPPALYYTGIVELHWLRSEHPQQMNRYG